MIGFIVFGLVVGLLARWIAPGRHQLGLLMTLAVGLVGSIIGGTIANQLGTGEVFELNFIGSVVAIASAAVLVAVVSGASGSRRSARH